MSLFSMFAVTDEQAMWRVQMDGDAESFALLMRRWEQPIRRLCTRLLGDEHRGEDLAQEAFARVFAKRETYVASSKFSTFLWRIALNLCYDEIRRRNRRRETVLEDETGENIACENEMAPDAAMAQQETGERVRHALMRLTEPYRAVLVLRHYEGLKFREIAEVLEVAEGTVKSRMAEALTQMSSLLDDAERRPGGGPGRASLTKKETVIL